MTCQELRLYFEDPLRRDDELRPELEHLAHCPDCTRFVESRRELGNNLRLFRDSAPVFPVSLDASILANYRQHITERSNPAIATPREGFVILRWSAAVAACALIALLLYLTAQKKPAIIAQPQVSRPAVAPETHPVEAAAVPVHHPKSSRPVRPKVFQQSPPAAVAATTDPLPPGFRSLMYCDELSCGDLMELIRVQLPPSAVPFANTGGGQPISADVIVGPDGIARGIRVVE